jgi:hypothetical protein
MKIITVVGIVLVLLLLGTAGVWLYFSSVANPRVEREIIAEPDGERARKVMLLTLPSGRRLPVNYLREDDRVYAAADGTWWKELVGEGSSVTLVVRGETLTGTARAVRDDPDYTADVFSRLRPNAIEGFGTLIEVRLDRAGSP